MDAESCGEKDSQTKLQTNCCDSYTQSSPNSIKNVTLLLSLSVPPTSCLYSPLLLDIHHHSKVWKGGEQNSVCVWGRRSVNEEGEAADATSRQRLTLSSEWNLGATKLLQTNSVGGPCPITAWNKRAGAPRRLHSLRRGGGRNEPSNAASECTHTWAQHLSFYLALRVPNHCHHTHACTQPQQQLCAWPFICVRTHAWIILVSWRVLIRLWARN